MTSSFYSLVDSDAFVGWFLPNDAHSVQTVKLFTQLEGEKQRLVTTSLVIAETATVLSHKDGQKLARTFLATIEEINFPVIHIDEELQEETIELFKAQDRKGTSMTDCANVAVIRRFGIPTIFSFDKVYTKSFGVSMLTSSHLSKTN